MYLLRFNLIIKFNKITSKKKLFKYVNQMKSKRYKKISQSQILDWGATNQT